MSVKGWWEECQEQTERPLPAAGANLLEKSSWLDVHADQEYVLQVSLRRIVQGQQRVSAVTGRLSFFKSLLSSIASEPRRSYVKDPSVKKDPEASAAICEGNNTRRKQN